MTLASLLEDAMPKDAVSYYGIWRRRRRLEIDAGGTARQTDGQGGRIGLARSSRERESEVAGATQTRGGGIRERPRRSLLVARRSAGSCRRSARRATTPTPHLGDAHEPDAPNAKPFQPPPLSPETQWAITSGRRPRSVSAPQAPTPAVMQAIDGACGASKRRSTETKALIRAHPIDFADINRRKSQGLLELTRFRGRPPRRRGPGLAERLRPLREKLAENQHALEMHVNAVREIADLMVSVSARRNPTEPTACRGGNGRAMIKTIAIGSGRVWWRSVRRTRPRSGVRRNSRHPGAPARGNADRARIQEAFANHRADDLRRAAARLRRRQGGVHRQRQTTCTTFRSIPSRSCSMRRSGASTPTAKSSSTRCRNTTSTT